MLYKTLMCLFCVFFTSSTAFVETNPLFSKVYVNYDIRTTEPMFEQFIETYNKSYSTVIEKQKRLEIFRNNLNEINGLNLRDTATFGVNQFADLTNEEFRQRHTGHKAMPLLHKCIVLEDDDIVTDDAPSSLDWKSSGLVTHVKSQGSCQSGWAFAIIGNIEGQYAKKYGTKEEFSGQQLVDCLIDCSGCEGCSPSKALSSLIELGGVMLESDYSYVAKEQDCQYKPVLSKVKLTGCTLYDLEDEDKLKEVLATKGPLYIAVNSAPLRSYRKGILKSCPSGDPDEAVLLTGYGTENGVDFWIIKSSWSMNWGEGGFGRIRRGVNACGLMNSRAATATIK